HVLVFEGLTSDKLGQADGLALGIWQLDADHAPAGIVATRAERADMLRAMSSASWMTRLALMPLAGSSSYIVTTGPGRTSTMSPRTWKSSSTLSSRRALRSSPARSIRCFPFAGARASRAVGGSTRESPSAEPG